MPISEAKKQANKKWDSENMAYQTVKVNKDLLQQFRQAVQDRGERVNTVLKEFMERYISGDE
jgi:uncharacterized protein (DUF4415 family)